MLWESAHLMSSILVNNPTIVAGKRVLELGCGCTGICSMVASKSADLVVATDGDPKALDLLAENVSSNLEASAVDKLVTAKLDWGHQEHIAAIKEINSKGFDVIIGTDVTYVPEATLPLFATAKELISSATGNGRIQEPALILCHIFRRVDEPALLSAASRYGFRLVDRWPTAIQDNQSPNIISSWFSENASECIPNTALHIMYFCLE